MTRILELLIVMGACLAPMFILASRIDSDEIQKAGLGVVLTAIAASYRSYLERERKD